MSNIETKWLWTSARMEYGEFKKRNQRQVLQLGGDAAAIVTELGKVQREAVRNNTYVQIEDLTKISRMVTDLHRDLVMALDEVEQIEYLAMQKGIYDEKTQICVTFREKKDK